MTAPFDDSDFNTEASEAAPLGRVRGISTHIPNVWEEYADDFRPDYGPTPEFFTIVHLIWLQQHGYIDSLPVHLGPYPMMYRAGNPELEDQLREWGVIENGDLTESAADIISAPCGAYEWALWGLILLPVADIGPQEIVMPQPLIDYGVQHSIRTTPRMPFMVCVRQTEIVSVLSTYDRLFIAKHRIETRPPEVLAAEVLRALFDPEEIIKPMEMSPAAVPASFAAKLGKDTSIGNRDGGEEGAKARADAGRLVKNRMAEEGISSTAAPTVAAIAEGKVDVMAQVSIIDDTKSGFTFPRDLAGCVAITENGMMVSYPSFPLVGPPNITYRGGDDTGFTELVRGLRETARRYRAS